MTIYVDNYQRPGRCGEREVFWSHVIADTDAELVEFGMRAGLEPMCDQAGCTVKIAHFDVIEAIRQELLGTDTAQYIAYAQFGEMAKQRAAGGRRAAKYNPVLQRHSWTKLREHHYRCDFCEILYVNTHDTGRRDWWRVWRWPDGREGTTQGLVPFPKCPGPSQQTTGQKVAASA